MMTLLENCEELPTPLQLRTRPQVGPSQEPASFTLLGSQEELGRETGPPERAG